MTIRFDDALDNCRKVLASHISQDFQNSGKVVLIRDLLGRLHLAVEHGTVPAHVKDNLAAAAGPFWSPRTFEGKRMVTQAAIFNSPDLVEDGSGIALLERGVIGAEWTRSPRENREPTPPRATLFGLKGGVGRSTALCVWARHLANLGKRVLVVDLDLESPGVSSLLLPALASADFGLVDWFVEEAVGNADNELLRLMVARSPLATDTAGDILVAPCVGSHRSDYMAKLSRAYIDLPGANVLSFGARVAEMLDQLEETHQPDVVLLDSRAGLHDLAGIAATQLGAMTFLFAGASRQTWDGYRHLLKHWAKFPTIAQDVRERVRVVAAMIPETDRKGYVANLKQSSYDIFMETLYEEAGSDAKAFNFDIDAEDAPHFPLNVYWSRVFQDWDPVTDAAVTSEQLTASYSHFLEHATDLLTFESGPAELGTGADDD